MYFVVGLAKSLLVIVGCEAMCAAFKGMTN